MISYSSIKYTKYYFNLVLKNWFSTRMSYSQHGEDILIEKIIKRGEINSFLDIGANDGVLFSNSYKFAKKGARGLCIEPSRLSYRKLFFNHLIHNKVKCLNIAISEKDGLVYLQESGYEQILSKVTTKKSIGYFPVKAFSLKSIFECFPEFSNVDLISIDVEGHEDQVLLGLGNKPIDAKIIILEIDKANVTETLKLKSLSNHIPKYSNDVNLILLHKKFSFNNPLELPTGFYKC